MRKGNKHAFLSGGWITPPDAIGAAVVAGCFSMAWRKHSFRPPWLWDRGDLPSEQELTMTTDYNTTAIEQL